MNESTTEKPKVRNRSYLKYAIDEITTLQFKQNDIQKINGYKITIKSNIQQGTLYITKKTCVD